MKSLFLNREEEIEMKREEMQTKEKKIKHTLLE